MEEKLYLMNCPSALKAWRSWQTGAFSEASKYNHRLFTRTQVAQLVYHLNIHVQRYRNAESISGPDWAACDAYSIPPLINIGPGCSIPFIPVAGYFGK